jgi:UDP-glucose 4-epimerase
MDTTNSRDNNILIVGGAGFIGSHVSKQLHEAGYKTIVFDNLSRGCREAISHGVFVEGDMESPADLEHVFNTYDITAVMHFAAFIEVGESILNPALYYQNNVTNTLNLLNAMQRHGVKIFIFSSSAAVYGNPLEKFITEAHPTFPINPYGHTKLMVEQILHDYHRAYDFKYISLRYFNAAGGDPQGELKNYKTRESNLIPITLRSLIDPHGSITIYGTDYPTPDGTCIRDYIHIWDLGSAHILAMEKLLSGAPSSVYNLGNGQGFSVKEVLNAVERVTGKNLNIVEGARRPGDPPYLVADATKAKNELGWTPQYSSLEDMIVHAWKAMSVHVKS